MTFGDSHFWSKVAVAKSQISKFQVKTGLVRKMDEGMDTPLIRLPVHSVTRVGTSLHSRPSVSLPDPHEFRSVSWLHNEGYLLERSGGNQAHMGSGNSNPAARPAYYGAASVAPATHSTVWECTTMKLPNVEKRCRVCQISPAGDGVTELGG